MLRQLSMNDLQEIHFLRSDKRDLRYIDRDGDPSTEVSAKWLEMVLEMEHHNEVIT